MLGWNFTVCKQLNGGVSPATEVSATKAGREGARLAEWQTSLFGRDWIEELVKAGKAIKVADNCGYPYLYTAPAKYLLPTILSPEGPPRANKIWRCDAHDILAPWWKVRTVVDRAMALSCFPDEWLVVEVWDES
jgi:hypothetical protein